MKRQLSQNSLSETPTRPLSSYGRRNHISPKQLTIPGSSTSSQNSSRDGSVEYTSPVLSPTGESRSIPPIRGFRSYGVDPTMPTPPQDYDTKLFIMDPHRSTTRSLKKPRRTGTPPQIRTNAAAPQPTQESTISRPSTPRTTIESEPRRSPMPVFEYPGYFDVSPSPTQSPTPSSSPRAAARLPPELKCKELLNESRPTANEPQYHYQGNSKFRWRCRRGCLQYHKALDIYIPKWIQNQNQLLEHAAETHQVRVLPDGPSICQSCQKGFQTDADRLRHYRWVHQKIKK